MGKTLENAEFDLKNVKGPVHESTVHGEYYADYLRLGTILNSQFPRSAVANAKDQVNAVVTN